MNKNCYDNDVKVGIIKIIGEVYDIILQQLI
jgi:hypothetical protein